VKLAFGAAAGLEGEKGQVRPWCDAAAGGDEQKRKVRWKGIELENKLKSSV